MWSLPSRLSLCQDRQTCAHMGCRSAQHGLWHIVGAQEVDVEWIEGVQKGFLVSLAFRVQQSFHPDVAKGRGASRTEAQRWECTQYIREKLFRVTVPRSFCFLHLWRCSAVFFPSHVPLASTRCTSWSPVPWLHPLPSCCPWPPHLMPSCFPMDTSRFPTW